MKLKTKKIIIVLITVILAFLNLLTAYFLANGNIKNEEISKEVQTISINAQITMLCGIGVINLIILLLCKKILKNKKIIITLSIIQALFGTIYDIIGAIVVIVLLCIETKNVEVATKKIELPKLETIPAKRKWIYIVAWILIFIAFYTSLFSNLISLKTSNQLAIIMIIIIYLVQIVVFWFLLKEDIKRDIVEFKNNFKTYISYLLPRFGIFIVVYLAVSLPLSLFIGEVPTNQGLINELPIALTAIMAIIIAPFVEELMFRGILRKIFNNNKIFIAISLLTFGLVHVLYLEKNLLMYLYIVPYAIIGYFLAKTYSKTNNIFTNIFIHFVWNCFGVLISLLTILLTY